MTSNDTRFTPTAALLHPIWVCSLALLAVNDHILKGSGLLPGWFTGKLSDFAGLFVAPLLLAVVLRLRSRRSWILGHVAVGAVFAGIQLSSSFAELWSAAMGLLGTPWVITMDVTDLVALPVLVLSAWVYPRVARRPVAGNAKHAVELGAAVGGLACCVATSPPPGEWTPEIMADVFVHNSNDYDIVVRVRPLRPEADIDCQAMAVDPGGLLGEPLFGDATSWTLGPDANMTLAAQNGEEEFFWEQSREPSDCYAYILEADNVPSAVVFWMDGAYGVNNVAATGLDSDNPGYIDIRHGDEGGAYETGSELLFEMPNDRVEPDGQCAPAHEASRVAWSDEIPTGVWSLGPVQTGPDGCIEMDLRTGFQSDVDMKGESWFLCLPADAFPFVQGDTISILPDRVGRTMPGETSGLSIQRVDPMTSAPLSVEEGGDALVVSTGEGIADMFGATATFTPLLDCGVATEPACGTASRAGRLVLSGGEVTTVELGGTNTRADVATPTGSLSLHLVHAQQRLALDSECADGPDTLGTDIELVAVLRGTRP